MDSKNNGPVSFIKISQTLFMLDQWVNSQQFFLQFTRLLMTLYLGHEDSLSAA
jgi:hypothetical protein